MERWGVKDLECRGEGSGLHPLLGLGGSSTPTRAHQYDSVFCVIYEALGML